MCDYKTKDLRNLKRHKRSCKLNLLHDHNKIIEQIESKHNQQIQHLQSELLTRIEELKEKNDIIANKDAIIARKDETIEDLAKLAKHPRTIHKTINHDHRKIILNVHPYRGEPIEALPSRSEVRKLLRFPTESVPKFVQLKHFANNQNRNIRLPNRRGNTVQVAQMRNGELKWIHRDRKEVVDELLEENIDMLMDVYEADQVDGWNRWYRETGLCDPSEVSKKNKEWRDQLSKIDRVLMNNQESKVTPAEETVGENRDVECTVGTET